MQRSSGFKTNYCFIIQRQSGAIGGLSLAQNWDQEGLSRKVEEAGLLIIMINPSTLWLFKHRVGEEERNNNITTLTLFQEPPSNWNARAEETRELWIFRNRKTTTDLVPGLKASLSRSLVGSDSLETRGISGKDTLLSYFHTIRIFNKLTNDPRTAGQNYSCWRTEREEILGSLIASSQSVTVSWLLGDKCLELSRTLISLLHLCPLRWSLISFLLMTLFPFPSASTSSENGERCERDNLNYHLILNLKSVLRTNDQRRNI